jgi:hypothetical protein
LAGSTDILVLPVDATNAFILPHHRTGSKKSEKKQGDLHGFALASCAVVRALLEPIAMNEGSRNHGHKGTMVKRTVINGYELQRRTASQISKKVARLTWSAPKLKALSFPQIF